MHPRPLPPAVSPPPLGMLFLAGFGGSTRQSPMTKAIGLFNPNTNWIVFDDGERICLRAYGRAEFIHLPPDLLRTSFPYFRHSAGMSLFTPNVHSYWWSVEIKKGVRSSTSRGETVVMDSQMSIKEPSIPSENPQQQYHSLAHLPPQVLSALDLHFQNCPSTSPTCIFFNKSRPLRPLRQLSPQLLIL